MKRRENAGKQEKETWRKLGKTGKEEIEVEEEEREKRTGMEGTIRETGIFLFFS